MPDSSARIAQMARERMNRNPDLATATIKIKAEAIRYWHLTLDANLRAGHPMTLECERLRGDLYGLVRALAILIGQPFEAVLEVIDAEAKQTPTPPELAPIPGIDA